MIRFLGILLLLIASLSPIARAETLVVGGTGSALEIMRQIGSLYQKSHPSTRIEIPPSMGSSGAINAVTAGAIDVGVTGRPAKPGEGDGLRQIALATTPLAFVTSLDHAPDLATKDILAIYGGTMVEWKPGAPIRIVLRPRAEADIDVLARTFPGFLEVYERTLKRKELPVAATDQDNAELARSLPNSFALITIAQLVAERVPLKVISLGGVLPNSETPTTGTYPHRKVFYLIYRGDHADKLAEFLAFLKTPAVADIFWLNGARSVINDE